MTFTLSYIKDALRGNRVDVTVKALQGQELSKVVTALDGFSIGSDELKPTEAYYRRVFQRAGNFTPGDDHVVKVTVTDDKGNSKAASLRWKDQ